LELIIMDSHSIQKREKYLEELADAWLAGEHIAPDADAGRAPAAVSLDELLTRLATDPNGLSVRHLLVLSDLSREDAAQVRSLWSTIPVDRRRTVVRQLVNLAADNLNLLLGRLLRVALDDDDPMVRRLAVDGLMTDEDTAPDLVGPLVQILHNDKDAGTRAAAARALGAYVLAGELDELDTALAMRVEEALMTVLLRDEELLAVRCRALESLAYSGEIAMRQLIEDAYYAPEEEMRVSALNAMGRSADVRWRNLARAELQNPSAEMREAAAYATGALENKAAVSELIELLAEDVAEVKLAIIAALGQIGGKEAREILEAMRLSDDPAEVEAADLALEEIMFSDGEDDSLLLGDEANDWDDEPWARWSEQDETDLGAYDDSDEDDEEEDDEEEDEL
jgi:HEAT repeat protein